MNRLCCRPHLTRAHPTPFRRGRSQRKRSPELPGRSLVEFGTNVSPGLSIHVRPLAAFLRKTMFSLTLVNFPDGPHAFDLFVDD